MAIITPPAILSYPHLFEPQQPEKPDQTPKYGAAFLFEEGVDLTPLKKAAFQVVIDKFGEVKAKEMLKNQTYRLIGGPHHSIRTDVASKSYPESVVAFINARSNEQPGIVSVIPHPETGKPMPITEESQMYPGVRVKAFVNPYWYDVEGNKGVAWGLNAVQKIGEGDRLDGRVKAQDVFEADEDAVADLSDLQGDSEGDDPFEELTDGSSEDEGDLDLDELLG